MHHNNHPKSIRISDYDYELPAEKIAVHPLAQRDQSKLLVYHQGEITHHIFSNLPDLLSEGDVLLVNNTKVIQARLLFQTQAGKKVEIFCLSPYQSDIQQAMMHQYTTTWEVLIGGLKKWDIQETLHYESADKLSVKFVQNQNDGFIVEFNWESEAVFADLLNQIGQMPLPPYLKRVPIEDDKNRYQTVYAHHNGSVAAPTAGLHFTPAIFDALNQKGIDKKEIVLHVGAGTFRPVKSESMEGHNMHEEEIVANIDLITFLAQSAQRIVAVGTTSARSIESLYWFGVRLLNGWKPSNLLLCEQWTPYDEVKADYHLNEAFQAVSIWMQAEKITELKGTTALMIAPGYQFKVIKGLITNFHQPSSTLILLVSAAVGNDWRKIYETALENDYRFLSYGDSSLIWI